MELQQLQQGTASWNIYELLELQQLLLLTVSPSTTTLNILAVYTLNGCPSAQGKKGTMPIKTLFNTK
jgi:hypothetical protein